MLVKTHAAATAAECDDVRERIEAIGARVRGVNANGRTVLICAGDTAALRRLRLESMSGVESVFDIPQPYKLAARNGSADTIVRIPGPTPTQIGGRTFTMIAGPCAVENLTMLRTTATAVGAAGANLLRGGAFKPRTSPYAFQGLGEAGLEMLGQVRAETGLPVVTEVMDARQIEAMLPYVDVFQVGARNMQNYTLLAELGRIRRPVLLKRSAAATIEELLLAAEHILAPGNGDVILCERGVRARETKTRNTLDIAAVPVLKRETHLPVIVDPSHAAGRSDLVLPLSLAALAAGADGIMVEVHPHPAEALSDGDQSLTPSEFRALTAAIAALAPLLGREVPAVLEPVRAA
jgi:3-deoxy-7-phosphoheptulonate synthase